MAVHALGQKVAAPKRYAPDILEAISRREGREALGPAPKSMVGHDCWHLYELSWLNLRNEPQHCVGVLLVDSASPATIESKSLKLYLNARQLTLKLCAICKPTLTTTPNTKSKSDLFWILPVRAMKIALILYFSGVVHHGPQFCYFR